MVSVSIGAGRACQRQYLDTTDGVGAGAVPLAMRAV
jgi:ketopantoate hydroxymethyltransferase